MDNMDTVDIVDEGEGPVNRKGLFQSMAGTGS